MKLSKQGPLTLPWELVLPMIPRWSRIPREWRMDTVALQQQRFSSHKMFFQLPRKPKFRKLIGVEMFYEIAVVNTGKSRNCRSHLVERPGVSNQITGTT